MEALTGVELPSMRDEVLAAVEALSNPDHQQAVWIEKKMPRPGCFDNLDLEIHRLFDDTTACADPDGSVPAILYPSEREHFRRLGDVLRDLLDDHTLVTDADFIRDSRWLRVVAVAQEALTTMRKNGDGLGTRNVIRTDRA